MNVFELIKKKLEKKKTNFEGMGTLQSAYFDKGLECAISIVDEVAQEYNNGWIPCSERLPEEFENIYIDGKLMGSDDGQSYKSVFGETEQKDCFYGYYHNGKFFGYTEQGVFWRIDAIAWQPLPTPYKEGE